MNRPADPRDVVGLVLVHDALAGLARAMSRNPRCGRAPTADYRALANEAALLAAPSLPPASTPERRAVLADLRRQAARVVAGVDLVGRHALAMRRTRHGGCSVDATEG